MPARRPRRRCGARGHWKGTAKGGRTHLVYRVAAEPGAGVAPVFVRMTYKSAVTELFRAIEQEALRRARARGVRPRGTD